MRHGDLLATLIGVGRARARQIHDTLLSLLHFNPKEFPNRADRVTDMHRHEELVGIARIDGTAARAPRPAGAAEREQK
jgi:hypothetical protein